MVGDSETDVLTAKAAAVPVIGVTFGYTDKPVTELGCDGIISHYAAFLETLARVRPA
jgi:phosphoglycolate phosphatase